MTLVLGCFLVSASSRVLGGCEHHRKIQISTQLIGCSTVLLPDRVVQALNLNLEAMDARSQPRVQARFYNGESGLTLASGSKYPNNMAVAQQRRNVRTENTYSQPASMSQEFVLPQDWTY
ncbi:uncharacterized protein LOC132605323 [Lycium barbarum]|uniref:uncharacterized protein LOC132605323 n=1 Tax=Lycium barbarum TaxID=112863 RepID=UPI00293E6120|nr:uncharacterized protein LOC132605323 [Lycium barbarum]